MKYPLSFFICFVTLLSSSLSCYAKTDTKTTDVHKENSITHVERDIMIKDANGRSLLTIDHTGTVKDANGRSIIGFDHNGTIKDANGRSLMSIEQNGTIKDANGRIVGQLPVKIQQ